MLSTGDPTTIPFAAAQKQIAVAGRSFRPSRSAQHPVGTVHPAENSHSRLPNLAALTNLCQTGMDGLIFFFLLLPSTHGRRVRNRQSKVNATYRPRLTNTMKMTLAVEMCENASSANWGCCGRVDGSG
jgi:hypothetical protein